MAAARPRLGILCSARTRRGPESVLLRFMRDYFDVLKDFDFSATGGTAQSILDLGLYETHQIEFLRSGRNGGVVELAAKVAKGEIDTVIFLTDPRDLWADVPENRALKRVCIEMQVHLVTTRAGAEEWVSVAPVTALARTPSINPTSWQPDNWYEGISNVEVLPGGTSAKRIPIGEMTLGLISHDAMKGEMAKFVNDFADQLSKFHRILATGTTGWLLRLNHVSRARQGDLTSIAQGRMAPDRYAKVMEGNAALPTRKENQAFSDKIMPLASGPKGGDVMIANEILNSRCHKVVFFYDPDQPHPHEADIRLLERTAQLEWVYAFCISDPRSARQWAQSL